MAQRRQTVRELFGYLHFNSAFGVCIGIRWFLVEFRHYKRMRHYKNTKKEKKEENENAEKERGGGGEKVEEREIEVEGEEDFTEMCPINTFTTKNTSAALLRYH